MGVGCCVFYFLGVFGEFDLAVKPLASRSLGDSDIAHAVESAKGGELGWFLSVDFHGEILLGRGCFS